MEMERTIEIEMETQNRLNENSDSTVYANNSLRTAKCWRCQQGVDIGEIMRLCLCSDVQFVHVKCLEKSVNIRSIYHCRICDTSLPLRRKNKSTIKGCINKTTLNMLKGCCSAIFKMLILILFKISLIIIITYLITYLDVSKIAKFVPILMIVLILLGLLLFPIFQEFRMMLSWITSVREYCQKWYESNQEMKLDTTAIAYQRLTVCEEVV